MALETAAPGQVSRFDTGDSKLAPEDARRAHGSELVSLRHESISIEGIEERDIATPGTAQGSVIHSDRLVYLGAGKTRARYRWRLIDATAPQGRRRTLVSSLLDEPAERLTQLRAYRWTIEIVCRGRKRVRQFETLISVSPGGMQLPVAVALITDGLLLRSHAGGA